MKKAFLIFFVFVFFTMSAGVVKYVHYCGGILKEISFNDTQQPKSKNCPVCGKQKQQNTGKTCCKHEMQVIKVSEKAQKITQYDFPVKYAADFLPRRFLDAVFSFEAEAKQAPFIIIPLYFSKYKSPLYILHCVFRI